ncbi:MAG: lipocalin family protein [Phycisphaerales bacterium]|nr:lipocalin family protein [Phycisphaerales bacterium]MCB9858563.1 lipocalin family protein [Phycisphaerales bacterium]
MRFLRCSSVLPVLMIPVSIACVGANSNLPALDVAKNIDLSQYTGLWYEIAKYPVSFEQGCVNVTAEYTLRDDGTIRVLNTCGQEGGESRTIEGFATVGSDEPTKLTVYFFWPFGAPYWILEVGDDYEYAVVGDPSRTYFWILSRTPQLDDATYQSILARMPDWGYDPARLELMPQGV